MAKRIEYIDIAKGIGILLVVMGHNDFGLVSPFFYKLIYAFHMPLFFFVSGMFFKTEIPFLTLLRRRFRSLIQPYLVIILIIFFMTLSFTKVNFDVATARVLKAMYANGHYIDWVQLWFLPHLFALNIFAYGFYLAVKRIKIPWVIWLTLIIMLSIGVTFLGIFWPFSISIFGRNLTLFGLPLSIDLLLVSGFFFIMGCEVNKVFSGEIFAHPITLIGSAVGLVSMVYFLPQTIDFNTRFYQSLPINTLEALLGITLTLAIARQIERIRQLSAAFRYVGQASIFILIFHVPIQESWGEKIFNLTNDQVLSYWLSYIAGVIFPILINHFAIQPNPVLRSWFGQSGKPDIPKSSNDLDVEIKADQQLSTEP
ncbi:MAG TPA: acyltransferase family protein [Prolixibacteraceae bacterium]|jgi:fucose 4-O-acetylase-like acetyltransferase